MRTFGRQNEHLSAQIAHLSRKFKSEWMVLGIGINVNTGPPSGTEARHKASFLTEQSGHPLNRVRLLLELVRALAEHYPQLGQTSLVTAWERRMIWRGKRVRVLNPKATSIKGIALGLDSEGALRLQPDDGRAISITAGEVSLTDT